MQIFVYDILTNFSNMTTFENLFANTTSTQYTININLARATTEPGELVITTNGRQSQVIQVSAFESSTTAEIALMAGSDNTVTITSASKIDSISISSPVGTYYPSTDFETSGGASISACDLGFCQPAGSKIGNLSSNGSASISIPANVSTDPTGSSKYIEIDYINGDIALSTSWTTGTNSRNLTVTVNDAPPVRIEVPLSGRHSELFGPGLGWWDSASFGLLTTGWQNGENQVVIGNVGGQNGVQSFGADFVGLRFFG